MSPKFTLCAQNTQAVAVADTVTVAEKYPVSNGLKQYRKNPWRIEGDGTAQNDLHEVKMLFTTLNGH